MAGRVQNEHSRGFLRGQKTPAPTRVTQFVWRGHRGDGLKGASLNGISGQGVEVHRLRFGFYLHRGRAVVLSRQAVQKRTQTLQSVQDQASIGVGRSAIRSKRKLRQGGNPHNLFRVRQGNHRAVQAYTGASGVLPGMFPAEAASGVGLILIENL